MSHVEKVWTWPIAGYLFLGGLGAGMIILASISDLFFGLGYFFVPCALGSLVALGLGSFLLIFELGRPFQFWRVFSKQKAILTFGAWMVVVLIVFDLVYASFWFSFIPWSGVEGVRLVVAVICLLLGLGVLLYTGIELSSMKARVFWNTPALPLVFSLSGLLVGAAADYLIVSVWPYTLDLAVPALAASAALPLAQTQAFLSLAVTMLSAATLIGVFLYVILMYTSSFTGARNAAGRWLKGSYALAFWGGLVIVGLVVPLLLAFMSLPLTSGIAAVCALLGGVVLRFLVVYCDDRRELPGEALYWKRLPEGDEAFLKRNW